PTSTGQNRHHGDDDDANQGVLQIDRGARILQFIKVPNDLVQGHMNLRHRTTSVSRCRKPYGGVYESIGRGASLPRLPRVRASPASPSCKWYSEKPKISLPSSVQAFE